MTYFRFTEGAGTRSDRSARDRLRHRQKVREAIKENIADIVSEESIMGQSGDKVVKIPIRGIKEYRFVYGENNPGVGQGDGDAERGQVVRRGKEGVGGLPDKAGDQPGEDYYETDITIEELVGIMMEDLELPDMERRRFAQVESVRKRKVKGTRRKGVRARLDKRKTALSRIKRMVATGKAGERPQDPETEDAERFPFHANDLKYRHVVEKQDKQSNAVVVCIMDTSGSMDNAKKYLARSFYFLLYQFVRARYPNVEVVFVAHTTVGHEVGEVEFFHKGESGGTFISSGYLKALEIIEARYHPALWNIYAFHCSDGDNFDSDNEAAFAAAARLCEVCNLFGYGEIKPKGTYFFSGSMLERFAPLSAAYPSFAVVTIEGKQDVWPQFARMLRKEKPPDA
jgi:sporulation protein YhbH